MKNIKIIVEFDGTSYAGWQKQKNADTIQERLQKALFLLTGENTEVIGASRTDAGVHAKGYTANFHTNSNIPSDRFSYALNSKLPEDIRVLSSEEVDEAFHSRYYAKGKTYSYTIINRRIAPAVYKNYMYQVKEKLHVDLMRKGAEYILGRHDFKCFKSSGSSNKSDERTIHSIEFVEDNDKVIMYITGDGFLYNMVRIIMGTLIDVGIGKLKPEAIEDIIKSKDRKLASFCAPARGLCLEKVYY